MTMDDATTEYWTDYANQLAMLLGLGDWQIRIDRTVPDNPNVHATIGILYGRRVADISLADSFMVMPRYEQRETMVHELLHCHCEDMDEAIRLGLDNDASERDALLHRYYKREREVLVDTLAVVMSDFLPMPELRLPS